MSSWIKLPLAPAMSALFVVALVGAADGCSSSTPVTSVYSYSDDSGTESADAGGNGNGNGNGNGSGEDSGNGTSNEAGGTSACTLPDLWSQNPTCDACQVKYCCTSIEACASDTECTAIYNCQANCYSGVGPDGGTVSSLPIDDAGDTAEDTCAANCVAAGTAAAQKLFAPQDTCVNDTSCATPCD